VLVFDAHPLCPTSASVGEALDRLVERLLELGCSVTRGTASMPELARTTHNCISLFQAFSAANLPPELRMKLGAAAAILSPDDVGLRATSLRGASMTHAAWRRESRTRLELRAGWQALLTPAFPHDHSREETRQLDIDGKKIWYYDQLAWATIAALTGLPATAAPIGRSDDGLPIGVQIVGGYLEDRTTIAFAALIEREFGGFTAPPNL